MTLLPTVYLFFHHQSGQPDWFLSQDRGWQVVLRLTPGTFHTGYFDGLCGRSLTGQYDCRNGNSVLQRPDYQAYVEDTRQELLKYHTRFGHWPDVGGGGFHYTDWWLDVARDRRLMETIWRYTLPVLADDYIPSKARPAQPLFRCMIRDGMGATLRSTPASYCCETEALMWPVSCEARADSGTLFTSPRYAGPQYSPMSTVRNTLASQWSFLRSIGLGDQTILPDSSPPPTPEERDRWSSYGLRFAVTPDSLTGSAAP